MHRDLLITLENQLSDYLLHPSRSRLGVGNDHHVVVPENKVVPNRGIHVMIHQFARLARPGDRIIGHAKPPFETERDRVALATRQCQNGCPVHELQL